MLKLRNTYVNEDFIMKLLGELVFPKSIVIKKSVMHDAINRD